MFSHEIIHAENGDESMRFEGKVALVTGASRGIGKSTAIKLANEGADVAVHYVQSAGKAEEVCDQIRAIGRQCITVAAEVTDREAVNAMAAEVLDELGRIDLLVNNAGIVGTQGFAELTPEQWDRIIAVNLTGSFNVI